MPGTVTAPVTTNVAEPPGAPLASSMPAIDTSSASINTSPPAAEMVPTARTKPPACTDTSAPRRVIVPLDTSSAPPAAMRSSRAPTSITEPLTTVNGVLTTHGLAAGRQRSSAVHDGRGRQLRRPRQQRRDEQTGPYTQASASHISVSRSTDALTTDRPGDAQESWTECFMATGLAPERQEKQPREGRAVTRPP